MKIDSKGGCREYRRQRSFLTAKKENGERKRKWKMERKMKRVFFPLPNTVWHCFPVKFEGEAGRRALKERKFGENQYNSCSSLVCCI